MTELESKRVFLLASESLKINDLLEDMIRAQIPHATVFTAVDGLDVLFKCDNVPPNVVILDYRLPKVSAVEVTDKLLRGKEKTAVIILAPTEIPERFMDQVATGQVQFLSDPEVEPLFKNYLTRALNWLVDSDHSLYRLRFLSAADRLIEQGEQGDHVYIVKTGELKAIRTVAGSDQPVELGVIKPGEFVGEMAYINGEARSASVVALTDCELIEIPSKSLDAVLFSKPGWSKALLKTLSKRLKVSIEIKG